MKTVLRNLQKPLTVHQTKICSMKLVCKGVPLPDTREYFYVGQSACIACKSQQSKKRWDEKKKDRENYF